MAAAFERGAELQSPRPPLSAPEAKIAATGCQLFVLQQSTLLTQEPEYTVQGTQSDPISESLLVQVRSLLPTEYSFCFS